MTSSYRIDETRWEFASIRPLVRQANQSFEIMGYRGQTRGTFGTFLASVGRGLIADGHNGSLAYEDLLDPSVYVSVAAAIKKTSGTDRRFFGGIRCLTSMLEIIQAALPGLPPLPEQLSPYHVYPFSRGTPYEPLSFAEEDWIRRVLLAEISALQKKLHEHVASRCEPFSAKRTDLMPLALLLTLDGGVNAGCLEELRRDCLSRNSWGEVVVTVFKPRSQRTVDYVARDDGCDVAALIQLACDLTANNAEQIVGALSDRLLLVRQNGGRIGPIDNGNASGYQHMTEHVAYYLKRRDLKWVPSGAVNLARLRATYVHRVAARGGLRDLQRRAGHQRLSTTYGYLRTQEMRHRLMTYQLHYERELIDRLADGDVS